MIAGADAVVEWQSVLDDLEQRLDATERLLAGDSGDTAEVVAAWKPPSPRCAIPAQLADRATRLLSRHEELAARLTAQLGAHRNHLRVADHFTRTLSQRGGAAYIDVTA